MTLPMTFEEFLNLHADFYEDTGVDKATQGLIHDFFCYRNIVDNDRFEIYFRRAIANALERYKNLLRLESIEFDPMVSNYVERYVITDSTQTGNRSKTGNATSTRTGNDTHEGSESSKPSSTTTTTVTGKTTTEGTTEQSQTSSSESGSQVDHDGKSTTKNKSRSLDGVLPDSSTYADGMPEALKWQFTSNQHEEGSDNDGTEISKDVTAATAKTTGTGSGTTNGTTDRSETTEVTQNGTDTHTSSMTINRKDNDTTDTEETETDSTDRKDKVKERSTGRSEAPQDMIDRARDLFRKSSAFDFLKSKLEPCFLGVIMVL